MNLQTWHADKARSKQTMGHFDVRKSIASLRKVIKEWCILLWTKEWEKETDPNQEKPKCRLTKQSILLVLASIFHMRFSE